MGLHTMQQKRSLFACALVLFSLGALVAASPINTLSFPKPGEFYNPAGVMSWLIRDGTPDELRWQKVSDNHYAMGPARNVCLTMYPAAFFGRYRPSSGTIAFTIMKRVKQLSLHSPQLGIVGYIPYSEERGYDGISIQWKSVEHGGGGLIFTIKTGQGGASVCRDPEFDGLETGEWINYSFSWDLDNGIAGARYRQMTVTRNGRAVCNGWIDDNDSGIPEIGKYVMVMGQYDPDKVNQPVAFLYELAVYKEALNCNGTTTCVAYAEAPRRPLIIALVFCGLCVVVALIWLISLPRHIPACASFEVWADVSTHCDCMQQQEPYDTLVLQEDSDEEDRVERKKKKRSQQPQILLSPATEKSIQEASVWDNVEKDFDSSDDETDLIVRFEESVTD